MSTLWTPERVEYLTDAWTAGYSAQRIADALGAPFTRNSVIGKAWRLDLTVTPAGRSQRCRDGQFRRHAREVA